MAVNRGVAPLDPNTSVGQFRLLSGDVEYVALQPPEAGFGDYTLWSDNQVEAFLALASGSIPRSIAAAYTQLAAATSAAAIKTDDLSVNGKDEVEKWLKLAAHWAGLADIEDGKAVDDYFDIVTIGGECYRPPEASPWRVDRWPSRGCW